MLKAKIVTVELSIVDLYGPIIENSNFFYNNYYYYCLLIIHKMVQNTYTNYMQYKHVHTKQIYTNT